MFMMGRRGFKALTWPVFQLPGCVLGKVRSQDIMPNPIPTMIRCQFDHCLFGWPMKAYAKLPFLFRLFAALTTVPQIGCGPQRSCGRIHQFVLCASR